MDAVFEKTRELGKALLESEAYQRVKEAEDRAMGNEEAARVMGEFLEKRQSLQALMQGENPDPGALKRLSDEMDELQSRLQLMDDMIGQINQVLQFIVTGKMDAPSGCTGSCETCSGCH